MTQALVSIPIVVILQLASSRITLSVIPTAVLVAPVNVLLPRPRKFAELPRTLNVIRPRRVRATPQRVLVTSYHLTVSGANFRTIFDIHIYLGQSCGSDGLACASGQCTSVSRSSPILAVSY